MALGASLALSSCVAVRGSGKKAEETRTVPSFSAISLSGGYEIDVESSPGQTGEVSLRMSGDDNLLPLVQTNVAAGKLSVDSKEPLWPDLPITLAAKTGPITSLEVSGSGEGRVVGLSGDKVVIDISGSGKLELKGKVKELLLDVAGSGDIDAVGVEAEVVTIDIAGSGEAKVCASAKLAVDISGSGKVEYHCDPKEVVQDIAGSGELVKR